MTKSSSSKSNGQGKSKSAPPASAFKNGKYASPVGKTKKNLQNELHVAGLLPGVVALWGQNGNKEEDAYNWYDVNLLKNSPDLMEELGINAMSFRRGPDGLPMKQSASSEYSWRVYICIVGEDNNTAQGRRALANKIIEHFNSNAVRPNYQYPKRWRFGGDSTTSPMGAADQVLLDLDVLGLVLAAYPGSRMGDIIEWDGVVGKFWQDEAHGHGILLGHEASGPESP